MAAAKRFKYTAAFVKQAERLTFVVWGFNKDDAYVDAVKQLEAMGESTRDWWYWGAERSWT